MKVGSLQKRWMSDACVKMNFFFLFSKFGTEENVVRVLEIVENFIGTNLHPLYHKI